MDAAEKKEIQAAVGKWLARRQQEVQGLCGAEIPYEFDWESFAGDSKGLSWLEQNGPNQVTLAFRILTKDGSLKAAARRRIRRIALRNVGGIEERSISLKDGVLGLECAFAQSPQGRFSDREIRQFLGEALLADEAAEETVVATSSSEGEAAETPEDTARRATDAPPTCAGPGSHMRFTVMIPATVDQAAAFCTAAAARNGWTEERDGKEGTTRTLTHSKGDLRFSTSIVPAGDKAEVTLGLSRE